MWHRVLLCRQGEGLTSAFLSTLWEAVGRNPGCSPYEVKRLTVALVSWISRCEAVSCGTVISPVPLKSISPALGMRGIYFMSLGGRIFLKKLIDRSKQWINLGTLCSLDYTPIHNKGPRPKPGSVSCRARVVQSLRSLLLLTVSLVHGEVVSIYHSACRLLFPLTVL